MLRTLTAVACSLVLASSACADDLNRPPIEYAKAPAETAVTRLQTKLATGKAKLKFTDDHGYLKSVLAALDVPESSQVLVFSKTSLQRDRITPRTPRIYFNDDVYVGFCSAARSWRYPRSIRRSGRVLHARPGAGRRPRFTRQTETCLTCHASSLNRGIPGHLVRSSRSIAEAHRSSPPARSAPTTPARSRNAGAAGTSRARTEDDPPRELRRPDKKAADEV